MEDKKYTTRSAVKAMKSDAYSEERHADSEQDSQSQVHAPDTPAPDNTPPPPDASMPSTVRPPRSVCSQASRLSRSEREARRMRAEYEAEVELVKLRESVVKKKLALEMAELAAEEEPEAMDAMDALPRSVVNGPGGRVEQWLQSAVPAPPRPAAPAPHAPAVLDPHQQQPTDIERLAEAIGKLAHTRPLPRQLYELPTFDGNPVEWLGFEKAYRSTTEINKFRPYENMARLRVALVGEAKIAVDDLMRTCSDPEEVIGALEEEFGHPTLLLECALQKVRDLPKVSENGRELRSFTNVVRNTISVLKSVRADGYINNPQIVQEILAKLTPYQRAQYGEFAMRKEKDGSDVDLRVSPNLYILVEFLTQITRVASYYSPSTSQPQPLANAVAGRRDKGAAPVRTTHRVFTQVEAAADTTETEDKDRVVCVMCNEEHKLSECAQFRQLTVNERWDFVKINKLCFKCVVKTHSSRFCRAKRCDMCHSSHHVLLHSDAPVNLPPSVATLPIDASQSTASQSASQTTSTDFETVTNVREFRARALLKVIPVTIVGRFGDERATYALLDDGASVSLIDENLANDIDGPVVPLRLMTARGHCATDDNSRSVKVVVRGPNGVRHDICARTMRNVDLPSQTLPARVFEDNAHLRHLDCSEMREAKPMLLLGQDNWSLIVGREIRQGKSGYPVASLSRLGWVVHGPLGAGALSNNTESANCILTSRPDLYDKIEVIGQKPSEGDLGIACCVTGGWKVGLPRNRYEYACRHVTGIELKIDRDSEFTNACTKVGRPTLFAKNSARNGIQAKPVWYLHFGVTYARGSADRVNDLKISNVRIMDFDIYAICVMTFSAYVDQHFDIRNRKLDSANSINQVQQLIHAIITHVHHADSVYIRGWVMNSPEPRENLLAVVSGRIKSDRSEKIQSLDLDIIWCPESNYRFDLSFKLTSSDLAPVKIVPIVQLELQAALLGCRLAVVVKSGIDNDRRCSDWHWVPSESYPADEALRMDWPIYASLGVSGPLFLCDSQVPCSMCGCGNVSGHDPERLERVLVTKKVGSSFIGVMHISTWTRAVATVEKLREAKAFFLRVAQDYAFRDEIARYAPPVVCSLSRAACYGSTPCCTRIEDGLLHVRRSRSWRRTPSHLLSSMETGNALTTSYNHYLVAWQDT